MPDLIPVDTQPEFDHSLFPIEGDPFGDRLATYGGNAIYSGGAYEDFRRSDNIEDRRHENYESRHSFVEDPSYRRDWLKNDQVNGPLGDQAGGNQIQESFDKFRSDALESARNEYFRRKSAGELVFDSRFEPPILLPVDHDPEF